ncbi:MAG: DUF2283 domain-containing protein [Azonexus sp.]|nr:DUF2283 domain-containing protein [Azonexus sp.]MBP6907915.1 DUF2283 domain-containing protein [Azonexus sp.]
MKLEYDLAADALYIDLNDQPIINSEPIKPGIIFDCDNAGKVGGIEVLSASKYEDAPSIRQPDPAIPTDLALLDAAHAADDGFRIPAAVANAILGGEQPVKVWRERRGLTQEALAAKAGISKACLCQIETRKRVGALKTLQVRAYALSVKLDDLREG